MGKSGKIFDIGIFFPQQQIYIYIINQSINRLIRCAFIWLELDLDSCDGADRVTAFIAVGGNKEKIDDFCGSGTPRELMSNSAVMSLHFHSTAVSKGARGFKARYAFVSSTFFPPRNWIFNNFNCISSYWTYVIFSKLNRFRNHDGRTDIFDAVRFPV